MLSVFLLKEKWKDDRNIDTHTQHFPILFRSIFVCVCKLPPPETLQSSYMWSKLPVSPRHFVPILEEMFCNVYKSVYSMSQCSCVCGMFNCFHVRNQEKCLCPKNLFVSTAWVKGKLCVTCGFQMYGKSLFTEHQDSRSAKGEKKNIYIDADSKFTQSEKEWASGRLVRSTASPHCLFHVDSCVYTGTITTVFNL